MSDFQMEHPDMVTNFSLDHDLYKYKSFKWTKTYDQIRQEEKKDSIFSDCHEAKAILATRYEPQGKFQFGVEIPYNARHALKLDLLNGNDLWKRSIDKELKEINDMKVFRKVTPEDNLEEYQRIPYHIVFACKFDLRRKSRLVCGGHLTEIP